MGNKPARSEDLEFQKLMLNSSQVEADRVCYYVQALKELGSIIERPHPCSRSLAYEQAKLKQSTRGRGATLHLEKRSTTLTVVTPHWVQVVPYKGEGGPQAIGVTAELLEPGIKRARHQVVQVCDLYLRVEKWRRSEDCYKWSRLVGGWVHSGFHNLATLQGAGSHTSPTLASIATKNIIRGSTLSWCKKRESTKGNLRKRLNTTTHGVKSRCEKVFGKKRSHFYQKPTPAKDASKTMRSKRNRSFTMGHSLPRSKQKARRLRPSEVPRGPLPPQELPSRPRCRKTRGNGKPTRRHLRSGSGAAKQPPEAQGHA